jgi:hypothetical protein
MFAEENKEKVRRLLEESLGGGKPELVDELLHSCEMETSNQLKWIRTRMKQAAPQTLIVAF